MIDDDGHDEDDEDDQTKTSGGLDHVETNQ